MSVSTLQRTNGEVTTLMKSEHGNSLYFISSAVGFLYNNFPKRPFFIQQLPKKVDFLTQTSPKKAIFWKKFKKIAPQNPGLAPRRGVGPAVPTRRLLPTLLYQRLRPVLVERCIPLAVPAQSTQPPQKAAKTKICI